MPSLQSRLGTFVSELRQRRVFRVAAVYAIVSWLIIQIAVSTFPYLQLPTWMVTAVIVLAIIGFPVALVLAWAFEATPEGVRRAEPMVTANKAAPPAGWIGVGMIIGLFSVGALGWYQFASAPGKSAEATELSIAVLPFKNLSASEDNEYFSDGITEDILTQLAMISDLSVVSRTSAMKYKDTELTIPQIAQELGVSYILEGSVRRAGDEVRVVAQLIDGRSDEHLWAETYDREMDDIFAVQSEVALKIAGAMDATLSPEERDRIEGQPTENMAAYDLVLRARELAADGREENGAAVELLKQAIQLDPGFADAYAALAGAYMYRVQQFGYPIEWADSGVVAARKAISLDPELPRGYTSLGSSLMYLGRLEEASQAYHRALELNPSSPIATNNLGSLELGRGNIDTAIGWLEQAMRLDPTSAYPPLNLGMSYAYLGDTRTALQWLDKAAETGELASMVAAGRVMTLLSSGQVIQAEREANAALLEHPADFLVLYSAGVAAMVRDEWAEAEDHLERLYIMGPDARPGGFPMVGTMYAVSLLEKGETERANELLETSLNLLEQELTAGSEDPGVPYGLAEAHALLGHQEAALEWLDRSLAAGMRDFSSVLMDPSFEALHSHPRFVEAINQMRAEVGEMRSRLEARAK